MALQYLIFDASDDGENTGTWEAVASVRTPQLSRVQAEVQRVLAWAHANSPGPRGPLDEGGIWDADHHTQTDGDWTAVTLTLVGPTDWGNAMVSQLSPDAN